MNRLNEILTDRTFTIKDNNARMMNAMLNPEMNTVGAIAEIADNTFEYGGTRLDITVNREEGFVEFSDNGPGCVDRDILLGQAQSGTKPANAKHNIGNYGIGLKDALGFFGGKVFYDSMTEDGSNVGFYVDYSENVATGKRFAYETPSSRKSHGLTMRCVEVLFERVSVDSVIADELVTMFAGGLESGLKITLNGIALNPPKQVRFIDGTEQSGELSILFKGATKRFRYQFGLTAPGYRTHRGYSVRLGYRTILSDYIQHGFRNYASTGFYGLIELINEGGKRFQLNRHKRAFDEMVPLLDGVMFSYIEPILIRLQKRAEDIVFPNVNNHQFPLLNGNKKKVEAKRDVLGLVKVKLKKKKGKKPTLRVAPGGTEETKKPRNPVHPLNAAASPKRYKIQDTKSSIELQFVALGSETDLTVINPKEQTILIQINTDHPGAEELQKDPERKSAIMLAINLVVIYTAINDGKDYPFYKRNISNDLLTAIQKNLALLVTDHQGYVKQYTK